MKTIKEKLTYIIYWIIIFISSSSMILYGILKPFQFESFKINNNSGLSEGHQLMWSFYSYSATYPIIIGICELIGGLFLLFNRTRIFGCILLTILLSNIILQDYLYEIKALNTAIYYQSLIMLILIFDKEKVKKVFIELFHINQKNKNISLLIIALIIAILFKLFENKFL
ncbi:hypothetical protein [Chishuiella sp.]|uniref:hypothetical protein n=1 Tax=Chishuiella sp. TaxID=1969467 RepID=UPI0028A82017|nr:hypothetical protein [Chishuiella sp.]